MNMDTLRAAVRPVTTLVLVAAFIAAAFVSGNPVEVLTPAAMLTLGYYFRERTEREGR